MGHTTMSSATIVSLVRRNRKSCKHGKQHMGVADLVLEKEEFHEYDMLYSFCHVFNIHQSI